MTTETNKSSRTIGYLVDGNFVCLGCVQAGQYQKYMFPKGESPEPLTDEFLAEWTRVTNQDPDTVGLVPDCVVCQGPAWTPADPDQWWAAKNEDDRRFARILDGAFDPILTDAETTGKRPGH